MKGLMDKSAKGKGISGARTHPSSTSRGDDEYIQVIEDVKKFTKPR